MHFLAVDSYILGGFESQSHRVTPNPQHRNDNPIVDYDLLIHLSAQHKHHDCSYARCTRVSPRRFVRKACANAEDSVADASSRRSATNTVMEPAGGKGFSDAASIIHPS
jgi:hypothetical protein